MRSGNSPRLVAIAGRAVLTMVESNVCMKKPVATSHSITVSERGEGLEGVLAARAGGVGVVGMAGGWAREGGLGAAILGKSSARRSVGRPMACRAAPRGGGTLHCPYASGVNSAAA